MNAYASVRALVRDTCGHVLSLSGVTAPAARLRRRLSIITFHRVLTEPQRQLYPLPGLAITPEELDAYLKYATRHFRCLSLTSALDRWAQDSSSDPPLLAITFDDGQLDNYQNALPILERNGVTASFYVPSQILEDPSPLWHDALATSIAQLTSRLAINTPISAPSLREEAGDLLAELHSVPGHGHLASHTAVETALEATKQWSPAQRTNWILRAQTLLPRPAILCWDGFMNVEQMKDLIARGHEIGSHSHSHALLPQCSAEQLLTETVGSKLKLESALGAPITTFCYPNGSTDQRSVATSRGGLPRRGHHAMGQQLPSRRFSAAATIRHERKARARSFGPFL